MKSLLAKILCVLLASVMVFGLVACGGDKGDSTGGSSSSTGGDDPTPTPPVEQDYVITFHYDFDENATLDADGKASAYLSEMELTSKKGKKVNLTTGMKEAFAMDGYKIKGYSTTAWQKDGITSDMDVYVLYEKSGLFTITFANPDGSTIKTLEKIEGSSVTADEYPTESEVTVTEGCEFIGWDVESIDEVTKSVTVTALEGNTLKLETENSHYYYQGVDKYTPVVSSFGTASGGKAVYLNQNDAAGMKAEKVDAIVVMEFTLDVSEDKDVSLGVSLWYRGGAENKAVTNVVSFSLKQAGADDYANIETAATYSCTNAWGNFVDVNVAKISLKKGQNVIKLVGTTNCWANVDYITLKGDVKGIYMDAHVLTLGGGATFSDGTTSQKVETGSSLPLGIVATPPTGQELVGWTDGETTWTTSNFVMPEKDVTITPIFKERKHPEVEVGLTSSDITVDGVKDDEYVKLTTVTGNYGSTYNAAIGATVYMLAKDNGIYVFVDVNDDVVVSRGKEFIENSKENLNWSYINGWKNDMVEFWFEYGDVHTKLQFDAFGYHVRSDKDGLAESFANLSQVKYATTLKGDDKLAEYKTKGDAVVSNTATGYTVEFYIPLEAEGTSVQGKNLLWALQINSVSNVDGDPATVTGYKLKTEGEMAEIEKVNKATFNGVIVPPAKSITIEAEDANSATSDGAASSTLIVAQAAASGGKYLHTANENGRKKAVITYNITATKDTTVTLTMWMGHRDTQYYAISDYINLTVNGDAVSFGDKKFTIEGWWKDTNGDGTNGKGYVFEEIVVGEIQLKAGQPNVIKIETTDTHGFWELDYFTLSGDVEGVAHVKNA